MGSNPSKNDAKQRQAAYKENNQGIVSNTQKYAQERSPSVSSAKSTCTSSSPSSMMTLTEEEQIKMISEQEKNQDTSRDNILTLIMQADEFLRESEEFDTQIEHWRNQSAVDEVGLLTFLGLRGHVQGELLRIQQMLLEIDPSLDGLTGFEMSYPNVVAKLKTSAKQHENMSEKDVDSNVEEIIKKDENEGDERFLPFRAPVASLSQNCQTASFSVSAANFGNSISIQAGSSTENPEKADIAIQNDIPSISPEELKEKHRKEEEKVNKVFQKRMIRMKMSNNLGEDNLKQLLDNHSLAMQALKRRQEKERRLISEKISMKEKERENSKIHNRDFDSDDDTQISKIVGDENDSYLDDFGEPLDEEQFKEFEGLVESAWENIPNFSKEDIMKIFMIGQKNMKDSETETKSETDSSEDNNSSDEDSLHLENDGKTIFMKKVLGSNLDKDEILSSIENHLYTKKELRDRRKLENDMHKLKISNKMAEREKNYDLTKEDQNYNDLERQLNAELAGKIAEKPSEEELKKLIEEYQRQRLSMNEKRNSEKEKVNNAIQRKREERRRKLAEEQSRKNAAAAKNIDYSKMDVASMFDCIKGMQTSGQLTKAAFQDMMLNYTKNITREKSRKKPVMSEQSTAQATETILKEHEMQAKKIKNIHDKEADKFRKQLEEKKKERLEKKY